MFKRDKKLLGEILLETGLINQQQLFLALEQQKISGERLGRILIEKNFIAEQQILDVLEEQLGIRQINLFEQPISTEVVRLIPESLARRYKVICVKVKNNKINLAMSDPLNVYAIDDIKMAAGKEIEPVLAPEEDILKAIEQYYGINESVNKALRDISTETLANENDYINLNDIENIDDDAPIVRIVNSMINRAIRERASDIHIEPLEKKLRVRFRIDGVLMEAMSPPKNAQASIISRIKIMANLDIAEHRLPQDGRFQVTMSGTEVDLRVSILPTIFGEKVVIRVLNKDSFVYDLDQLGFLPETKAMVEHLIKQPNGMILVTGPTGCGKSTTLYSILSRLNRVEQNIITVEDPVEFRIDGINQVQVNPKIGLNFASGLRSILRQDPNVIMVGEIRDRETADISVRSALTGHMVLSTLHTNDAAGTLARLLDMGVEHFLVASSVLGIIAQRLVRRICPHCKETYTLASNAPERVILKVPSDMPLQLQRGRGCGQCNNTGYLGRMAIHEVMVINPEIKELINNKASSDLIKEAAVKNGMKNLFHDGMTKVLNGETTFKELLRSSFIDDFE